MVQRLIMSSCWRVATIPAEGRAATGRFLAGFYDSTEDKAYQFE